MTERADFSQHAILVIHGIGEQKQSETIRNFVHGLVGDDFIYSPVQVNEDKYSCKLTHFSDAQETRYDFFEYYWASNFRDTNYYHVINWLRALFAKEEVPLKLYYIKVLISLLKRYIVSMLIYMAVLLLILPFVLDDWYFDDIISIINLLAAVSSVILFFIGKPILKIIGDVARYLYNSPNNIDSRDKVKAEGVQFLKQIHEQKNEDGSPKYDKVLVVGHSLGSIIGYHILSTFWAEKSSQLRFPNEEREALEQQLSDYNQLSIKLNEAAANRPKEIKPEAGLIGFFKTYLRLIQAFRKDPTLLAFPLQDVQLTKDYHEIQQRLQAIPTLNSHWRISDFITLGSPLHYSDFLLTQNRKDLSNRILQREMPTCPPVSAVHPTPFQVEYYENNQLRFHHAAVFSLVKWSNIFYRGDLIAGELNHLFGQGIQEYEVELKKGEKLLHQNPTSHTKYWERSEEVVNESLLHLKGIVGIGS